MKKDDVPYFFLPRLNIKLINRGLRLLQCLKAIARDKACLQLWTGIPDNTSYDV
jgi:hypothetical protein